MLLLIQSALLLIVFSSRCHATGSNTSSSSESVQTVDANDPVTLLTRWNQLHSSIYQPNSSNGKFDLNLVRDTLREMVNIEREKGFERVRKSLGDLGSKFPDKQKKLSPRFRANLMLKPDSTMTDLMLQTFDYKSNHCNALYFEQLNVLVEAFQVGSIHDALLANRQLQYENCWKRLMNSLMATSELVGYRARSSLNELYTIIYPNITEIIDEPVNSRSADFKLESIRIAHAIATSLQEQQPTLANLDCQDCRHNYELEFVYAIEHDCHELIATTKDMMLRIYRLLKYLANENKNFITNEHARIVNRYFMCYRLLSDMNKIKEEFVKFMTTERENATKFLDKRRWNARDVLSKRAKIYGKRRQQLVSDNFMRPMDRIPPIDLNVGLNIDDPSNQLITQQIPGEHEPVDDDLKSLANRPQASSSAKKTVLETIYEQEEPDNLMIERTDETSPHPRGNLGTNQMSTKRAPLARSSQQPDTSINILDSSNPQITKIDTTTIPSHLVNTEAVQSSREFISNLPETFILDSIVEKPTDDKDKRKNNTKKT